MDFISANVLHFSILAEIQDVKASYDAGKTIR